MKQIGVALLDVNTKKFYSGYDYSMCNIRIPVFDKVPLVYDSISEANEDKLLAESNNRIIEIVNIYTD